jgi:hypothetical protein
MYFNLLLQYVKHNLNAKNHPTGFWCTEQIQTNIFLVLMFT